jgi:chorismate mutase
MELMSEGPPNPEDFVTLDDVFSGIDLVDRQLIDLLSRRLPWCAAAKLNDGRFNLDDEERRRAVLSAIAAARSSRAGGAGRRFLGSAV